MAPRIVLLHGIATTAAVWDRVVTALAALGVTDVVALQRPCTGSLPAELDALAPLVHEALVVGQSGGATLALALAGSDHALAGAVAHEPAVGSLVPALLAPVAAAKTAGASHATKCDASLSETTSYPSLLCSSAAASCRRGGEAAPTVTRTGP